MSPPLKRNLLVEVDILRIRLVRHLELRELVDDTEELSVGVLDKPVLLLERVCAPELTVEATEETADVVEEDVSARRSVVRVSSDKG